MFPMFKRLPRRGQSMVEFSLVAPVLIAMLFFMIDFGRLVYTFGAISWATREGARMISLAPQQFSDCAVLTRVEQVGRGFPISPDPNSIVGNTDPNNPSGGLVPTTPPPGQGYIYVWPAVATKAPQDSNCNGKPRKVSQTARDVAVQVEYTWLPLMPLISNVIPQITIKTISVVHTEY
jgi:Flp pilus assembly protein TadG